MNLPSIQDSNNIYLLGSQNKEKESRMVVVKDLEGKSPRK